MAKIVCPDCGEAKEISLIDSVYQGPYRCWNCRKLLFIKVENDEMVYHEPLSEEDLEKWLEKDK